MAAPTLNSFATGDQFNANNTNPLTVSTGTTDSSTLLIALLVCGAGGGRYVSVPSGWNALSGFDPQTINLTTGSYIQFMWHYGTHASTVDFVPLVNYAGMAAAVINISGADNPATTPIVMSTPDPTAYTGGTDSTNLTFPTATPTVNDSLCFSISLADSNSSTGVQTDPAGETSYIDYRGTSKGAIGVGYFTHGASAIGTRTGGFNPTHRHRAVATMCIAPTAAAPAGAAKYAIYLQRMRAN